MAVVPDPRWRVLDASGNAIVGATMTVYVAGGTTPASLYSDAALTVPITLSGVNASDAEGYFPQWFAAEGTTFDITVKDFDGAPIPGRSYVSVPTLGSDTGTLTRDFVSSRFRVRNVGGVVYIETGNASGDDVGGSARMSGWNATQGDDLTLDYAAVNVTGTMQEGGKGLQGVVYTPKTDFAAVGNIVIPLPTAPAGVLAWDVDIFGMTLQASMDIALTASTDNGVSYLSASYGYDQITSTGNVVSSTHTAAAANFPFGSTLANGTRVLARIRVYSSFAIFDVFAETVSALVQYKLSGRVGTTAFTHLKLTASTGAFTGSYRVVPLRGFN